MSALAAIKDKVVQEYRHSPAAFWIWILLCVGGIIAYAYLKTGQ